MPYDVGSVLARCLVYVVAAAEPPADHRASNRSHMAAGQCDSGALGIEVTASRMGVCLCLDWLGAPGTKCGAHGWFAFRTSRQLHEAAAHPAFAGSDQPLGLRREPGSRIGPELTRYVGSYPTEGAMTANETHQQPEQLLTVADIAGIVGAHEQTVRHWIKTRELQASKFGTRIGYRIKRSDFEAFLDRRTLTGALAAQLLKGAAVTPES